MCEVPWRQVAVSVSVAGLGPWCSGGVRMRGSGCEGRDVRDCLAGSGAVVVRVLDRGGGVRAPYRPACGPCSGSGAPWSGHLCGAQCVAAAHVRTPWDPVL